jgi:hypothetical protein
MTLRRIAFALNALLTTMLANTMNSRRRKPGSGLFERAAVSENFDLRYLRQFDSVVREHGQALLEMLDEWLSRHEVRKGRGKRVGGHVGAGIYLFASKGRLFEI